MDNTKQDFEIRKDEIENYFIFLKIFEAEDTVLLYRKGNEIVNEKIQIQFQMTLIANAFILLYNLIESTVRNSIIELYSKINDENLNYEQLSENLKIVWIKQTTDNLKEGSFKPNTMRDYVYDLSNTILNKEIVVFSNDKMNFSGNLNAEIIRDIAKDYGFATPNNGRNLDEIKNKRNRLAHGEQTFNAVGKEFSVNDVIKFKEETFLYLTDVISKIEVFIAQKKYSNVSS